MRRSDRSLGPAFNSLFLGSLITNTGDGLRLAALPLLAAQLTSSPLLVAAVTSAQFLPWITFGPFGGALVDRWDRRRTIVVTQAWRGVVMAGLGALVLADLVAIWQIYVVAFVITVGEILVDPSVVALVPNLVDDDQLDTANGRIASVEIVTNDFAGGPIGATTFAFAPWLPFLIDGASYLGSVLPFRRLPSNVARSREAVAGDLRPASSIRSEAQEGFRWLRQHRVLGPMTMATSWFNFGAAAAFSLLVLLVTVEADLSDIAFGAVLAAGAIGAFTGSLAGGRLSHALGRRITLTLAAGAQGVALLGMALAETFPQLLFVWFLNGIPSGVWIPVARGLQQRLTPNHLLGRVNVSARVFTRGSMIVGALASGALASATSVRWSFMAAGAIEISAAVMIWTILNRPIPEPA